MQSTSNLQASGLNVSDNALAVGNNFLIEAENIIIKRNNVIESRRGFPLYGNSFGTETDRAKQLLSYKNRILRHYNNILQFDNGSGTFNDFAGTYSEVIEGLRIRAIEANGNLYFTTSDGIKKISAQTAADFSTSSGYITQAGGIKALDVTASLDVSLGNISGFLPQDSAVAYRIVWGTNDRNNNLILGSPSSRVEIYNPLTDLISRDFNNLLQALDNINQSGSLVNYGAYVNTYKLPINTTANSLVTNIVGLAGQLDSDITYTEGTIKVSTSQRTSTTGGQIVFTASVAAMISPLDQILCGSFNNSEFNNNILTVNSVSGTTIVVTPSTNFTTTDGAPIAESVSGTVNSYNYTEIVDTTTPTQAIALSALVLDSPPTDAELVIIQNTLDRIINRLKDELSGVIPTSLQNTFILPISITTTANVDLSITIPSTVTSSYFYQVYRSDIISATDTSSIENITPNDEMKLVIENFPTSAELASGIINVTDITPPAFAGANLYTNEQSGEGILQANDIPPLATDINRFKNVIFFANTKTRQRLSLSLLGITNLIADYNNGIIPKILITNGIVTNEYSFIVGVNQVETLGCAAKASIPASGYFDINSANNTDLYRFWYDTTGSDPAPTSGGRILVKIALTGFNTAIVTASDVASRTRDVISFYVQDFSASSSTSNVTITNTSAGYTNSGTLGPGMASAGFTLVTSTSGEGENATAKQVLLSNSLSPATAVDETARSLVHVINLNNSESVYAYYLSTANSIPGQMNIESRSLTQEKFYILGNNSNTGVSFSPDLSPEVSITSISTGAVSTITTSTPHGLHNGDQVVIMNTNSTPVVDGLYTVMSVTNNTFQIDVAVSIAGTQGSIIPEVDAQVSTNDSRPNRIFYSKEQEPEAVPLVNFIDVGAEDSAILRIFPLRESLFVFKEDGLFRVSGEQAPWTVQLFDSSTKIIAPDSVDVSNNLVYGWSKQGIITVSESGVSLVSRPIDTIVLPIGSDNYPNFSTATWGAGYESDNSYIVYTVSKITDTLATQAYRYSNLTNSWTKWTKTNTCGIVHSDERLYLGAGDINFIEKERKSFDRTDYADREYVTTIQQNRVLQNGSVIRIGNVSNYHVGDVLTQLQTVSTYQFNSLLAKLDADPSLLNSNYQSLAAVSGDDIRSKLLDLATKLDSDPNTSIKTYLSTIATEAGTIIAISADLDTTVTTSGNHNLFTGRVIALSGSNSSPSIDGTHSVTVTGPTTFTLPIDVLTTGTTGVYATEDESFNDILACFNKIITLLNSDTGLTFKNYNTISTETLQEAVITDINTLTGEITLNLVLDWVVGPITIYNAISTKYTYAPNVLGDPLSLKQVAEATLLFQDKIFTTATMSFATDLNPEFFDVPVFGDGNGLFGLNKFGTGYFGGGSHGAPFRTYVPRPCQRCTYILVQFRHNIAREKYSIYGGTLSGRAGISTRAYR